MHCRGKAKPLNFPMFMQANGSWTVQEIAIANELQFSVLPHFLCRRSRLTAVIIRSDPPKGQSRLAIIKRAIMPLRWRISILLMQTLVAMTSYSTYDAIFNFIDFFLRFISGRGGAVDANPDHVSHAMPNPFQSKAIPRNGHCERRLAVPGFARQRETPETAAA
jgi:archaellum biogenesis ATPase FlaH